MCVNIFYFVQKPFLDTILDFYGVILAFSDDFFLISGKIPDIFDKVADFPTRLEWNFVFLLKFWFSDKILEFFDEILDFFAKIDLLKITLHWMCLII